MSDQNEDVQVLDVVIVGAGAAGIRQLVRLRERGIDARILEAGHGAGGTWYWNRYPGCRLDVESYTYQYFFSEELLDGWDWSEEFAGQPELERYFNHVVDRFGLRNRIDFGTRVRSMRWDEEGRVWTTTSDDGRVYRSRFVVTAVGILSAPQFPNVPGLEEFSGEWYHTGLWPEAPVDLTGKRVAVVGTGSSGIQVVPVAAETAAHLTVLQRSPNWCTPLNNRPMSAERMREIRARYDEIDDIVNRRSASGFMHLGPSEGSILDLGPGARREFLEELYNESGMTMLYKNFPDVTKDLEANRVVNDYLASKIRERVNDPETAERLIPKDHGFAMKRPPMETGFYEAFNRDNVELVSLLEQPMVRFTPTGIQTTEREIDVDVIIIATGFDAVTGSFLRMDVTGVDGVALGDVWDAGPSTYLGVGVPGFPNLFIAGGPQSTRGNIPRFIEVQADWIAEAISSLDPSAETRIEATAEAAKAWSDHVAAATGKPIFLETTSWLLGTNVPGKAAAVLVGSDALADYRDLLTATALDDYRGFEIDRARQPGIAVSS